MKKYLLLFSLVSLIFLSCKKQESQTSEPKNILNDNAFIVDTSSILTSTENSFTLKKDATIQQPKINEIVLAAPSSNCPNGMLRKITGVTSNTSSITYTTEQSNLNDAFKELHINSSYTDTFATSQTYSRGSALTLTFNNNLSIGNGVKLNGVVKFNYPTIDVRYEKESGSNSPKFFLIKAELATESSSLELSNTSGSPFTISEKRLDSFQLPNLTIIIPIGSFPLPIRFKQQIVFKALPFTVGGKFNFKVLPSINATIGCKYENNVWSNLSQLSINSSSTSNFTFADYFSNGSAINAQLTIFNPSYEITPMYVNILKGTLEAPNSLNLEIKNTSPNYSLKYKLDAKGGIKQTFWMGGIGSFSLSGNVIEKTLLEGNWDLLVGKWKLNTTQTIISGIVQNTNPITGQYIEFKENGAFYKSSDGVNWSPSVSEINGQPGVYSKNGSTIVTNGCYVISGSNPAIPITNYTITQLSQNNLVLEFYQPNSTTVSFKYNYTRVL